MQDPREEEIVSCPVIRFNAADRRFVPDIRQTSVECALDICVNGKYHSTSLCSPGRYEDLVAGILAQCGLVAAKKDILSMKIDEEKHRADVIVVDGQSAYVTQKGRHLTHEIVEELLHAEPPLFASEGRDLRIRGTKLLAVVDHLLSELAVTHEVTNGVHSGILYDPTKDEILTFCEDIGRHNVFDKLYGWAILNDISVADKMIVFSGRCSTEMMMKLGRMGIPAVAAKSVPTTLSIRFAEKFGITLCARMRPGSVCVYTHPFRVVAD
ncbi:formate dehydrogenase accessory sulfurtransferase FdhD [Selenomonas sp. TAMA-11512]|uniref:formate dehydrogenase accessory sulfurtransferase FdhD n=1 Tax=Selenomonas sp. TAMA-11512 TaxID=3095337 RepID=UPI003084EEA7|nr:formate dehydrogenase accessory sulfurtransferase FdhD [Selenomonas sp. TAMA-11512]